MHICFNISLAGTNNCSTRIKSKPVDIPLNDVYTDEHCEAGIYMHMNDIKQAILFSTNINELVYFGMEFIHMHLCLHDSS